MFDTSHRLSPVKRACFSYLDLTIPEVGRVVRAELVKIRGLRPIGRTEPYALARLVKFPFACFPCRFMHPLSLCGPITVHTAMGERERESDGTDRVKGGKEERVGSAWWGGYRVGTEVGDRSNATAGRADWRTIGYGGGLGEVVAKRGPA